ncbi:Mur ligase family protein [Brucepastera parasyntrophica]|uniref:Mur ligase family protein n=1 Tax=Brucepastera parasyntrophica TaxID=2880008 RepID=UPI00210D7C63|nr:UDP-N-acetylmuramyl-tripeptide synthetase [Brucepastera parasyntrophica]
MLSHAYFGNPTEKLKILGITGTKGKSTTAYFTKYIFDEHASAEGLPDTAIISTIDTYDGKRTYKSKLTTPESFDLHEILYTAADSGLQNIVMEVSSQSLKYDRVYNVSFDAAAFLNISEDHIGPAEHDDFDDYFNSKLKIFGKTKIACINLDADFSEKILETARKHSKKVVTFSMVNPAADLFAYNIRKTGKNTVFTLKSAAYSGDMQLSIPGLFNVENALAAIAIALSMDISPEIIIRGLQKAASPGRMEIYHSSDEKILGIVDYAHNKLSFEKIFSTVKKEYPDRKIIAVFGCTGNKAPGRRKDLGETAGKNADYIYITADDPANESISSISAEVAGFVQKYTERYECIPDRTAAIRKAVEYVWNSDEKYIILMLGKGTELTQKVGSEYVPYAGDSYNIKKCIDEYENAKNVVTTL